MSEKAVRCLDREITGGFKCIINGVFTLIPRRRSVQCNVKQLYVTKVVLHQSIVPIRRVCHKLTNHSPLDNRFDYPGRIIYQGPASSDPFVLPEPNLCPITDGPSCPTRHAVPGSTYSLPLPRIGHQYSKFQGGIESIHVLAREYPYP
ncbi:hypothetical protein CRG98_037399 [Punica granatum]|uniref:Uncharacterized protein n=1 Tax=Punica granatum TaxID=22663 RepID=A0A2I0IDZ4_PUNGR|nr:hypothetical protein CRG98_037399 [Punica granatum]